MNITKTTGLPYYPGLNTGSVNNTPVNGATTSPISSGWAYDHEADNEEDIGRSKHILKGLMNVICNEDFDWDDFDTDDVDTDDIEQMVEDGLDDYFEGETPVISDLIVANINPTTVATIITGTQASVLTAAYTITSINQLLIEGTGRLRIF